MLLQRSKKGPSGYSQFSFRGGIFFSAICILRGVSLPPRILFMTTLMGLSVLFLVLFYIFTDKITPLSYKRLIAWVSSQSSYSKTQNIHHNFSSYYWCSHFCSFYNRGRTPFVRKIKPFLSCWMENHREAFQRAGFLLLTYHIEGIFQRSRKGIWEISWKGALDGESSILL